MKFENTRVFNFEGALRGMRNPKNSWHLTDSKFGIGNYDWAADDIYDVAYLWALKNVNGDSDKVTEEMEHSYTEWFWNESILYADGDILEWAAIGPKDMRLAKALISGGSEHRKFLRQIEVCVDITAPLFFWKEFDTYKVGTTANSTSTMHKLTSKPITMECFEIDDYTPEVYEDFYSVEEQLIPFLEYLRQEVLRCEEALKKDMSDDMRKEYIWHKKRIWKELVRWLPESWLQTRTVTLNYENILSMIHQRKYHKLNEWSGQENYDLDNFIRWARSLPYATEFLFNGEEIDLQSN